MKKTITLLLLMLIPLVGFAEPFGPDWHSNYRGYLGKVKGGLTLVVDGNSISGELYFDSDYKVIPIFGQVDDAKHIELKSADNIVITGQVLEDWEDIVGTILHNGQQHEVNVSLNHASFGTLENKYNVAGFDSDRDVESFAAKFKEAVLMRDTKQVASMLRYPIGLNLKDGSDVEIASEDELTKMYDKIFYAEFLKRFVDARPCNMFSKSEGVMMSSDDNVFWVWFSYGEDKAIQVISISSEVK